MYLIIIILKLNARKNIKYDAIIFMQKINIGVLWIISLKRKDWNRLTELKKFKNLDRQTIMYKDKSTHR